MTQLTYDPSDPEVLRDPFPHYRQLRDDAEPVQFLDKVGGYVISRYDESVVALRSPEILANGGGYGAGFDWSYGHEPAPGSRDHALYRPDAAGRIILLSDPPEHTEIRRVVSRHFTPKAVSALSAFVAREAKSAVDESLERSASGEIVDITHTFRDIPFAVILEILGIPEGNDPEFKHWTEVVAYGIGVSQWEGEMRTASEALCSFFDDIVAARRQHPGDDLISHIIASADEFEQPFTTEELAAFSMFLFAAGTDTTSGALANWFALAATEQPDLWPAVRTDPSLVGSSCEEVFRYMNSNQVAMRSVVQDAPFHGADLHVGDIIWVILGAANRDERHFGPDAGEYRVDRNPSDALGFGSGIHHCLGAPLARLETKGVIEAIVTHTRSVEPAGEVTWNLHPWMRSASCVPVTVR